MGEIIIMIILFSYWKTEFMIKRILMFALMFLDDKTTYLIIINKHRYNTYLYIIVFTLQFEPSVSCYKAENSLS